jgi:hypothetical protein
MVEPEDAAAVSPTPHGVERNLIVQQIPRESLSMAAGAFDLSGALAHYKSDWRVVSHTFVLQEDGSALLTCILERKRT